MIIREKIEIYTFMRINHDIGVWAAMLVSGRWEKEISGAETKTTASQLELVALISALRMLRFRSDVQVFTGSLDLSGGYLDLAYWRENAWINKKGVPVLDQKLWLELDNFSNIHSIAIEFIPSDCYWQPIRRLDELTRKKLAHLATRITPPAN